MSHTSRRDLSNVEVTDYAAAFFLLGDSLEDAINVCVYRLKDIQLAIAIARVYEGDHGPSLRRLLEEEVLSYAAQEGNRWLASWAFWMLNRKDMAVRALIVGLSPVILVYGTRVYIATQPATCFSRLCRAAGSSAARPPRQKKPYRGGDWAEMIRWFANCALTQTPVYNLLETPRTPEIKSQLFLTDDPALVVLYSQLRQQTLQTLRGASKVTPYAEWQFVLHSAKIYDRMGCDLLGLDLGKTHSAGDSPSQFGIGSSCAPTRAIQGRPDPCSYRRGEHLPLSPTSQLPTYRQASRGSRGPMVSTLPHTSRNRMPIRFWTASGSR